MQKPKIIIALVVVALLTLTIVGLASAQISANQTNPDNTKPNIGFWELMGNCFGLRNNQPSANQYVAPPTSTNNPGPAPNQNDGNYYGFGQCWTRNNPGP
jgi:hypothetical protein